MVMESGSSSKEKEVVVDIESDKSHEVQVNRATITGSKRGKRSLDKVGSGVLNYGGSGDDETSIKPEGSSGGSVENPSEAVELLVDKNTEEQQPLIKKEHEKERRKGGKVKKAAKPPRPPNGPTLSASDLRLIKEITEMAMKKRERIERIKQLRKMQAARVSSSSSSSSSSSHGSTIFAMTITLVFFLLLVFQGFITNTSSGLSPAAAPQPAPETLGTPAIEFYKAVGPDDGVAQSFVLSKSTEMPSSPDFSSPENNQQK